MQNSKEKPSAQDLNQEERKINVQPSQDEEEKYNPKDEKPPEDIKKKFENDKKTHDVRSNFEKYDELYDIGIKEINDLEPLVSDLLPLDIMEVDFENDSLLLTKLQVIGMEFSERLESYKKVSDL